jgi:DNA (cytosine-5)-methyltransferase 1
MQLILWWTKSRRAQNTEDFETWLQGGVTPTLNAFDNANENRATVLIYAVDIYNADINEKVTHTLKAANQPMGIPSVLIVDGTRVGDVRVYEDQIAPTVISRYGTGGGNVPMIFDNEPTAYSVREDAKADNFSATETEIALALQANQPSVQSHHAQLFIAQTEPLAYDEYNDSVSDVHHTLRAGTKQSTGVITEEPMVMRDREGAAGGGKGPLVSKTAFTLATSNFHTLFQPIPNDVMPTLTAANNPSRSPQSTEVTAQIEVMERATNIVRRLTPTECERLQGFPDGWTGEQADSNRYKQMGNAVAVPVVQWIINNVVGEHNE